jgi:sugar O-acyltransferase (sialic acid O-acetyltransferase NeuD family)
MMDKILVIGTGGLAREFTAWFGAAFSIAGYYSSNREEHDRHGLPGTLFAEDISPHLAGTALAVLAVGSPPAKATLHARFAALGFRFPVCIHPQATVAASARLADGVVVSPQSVVSAGTRIGTLAYLNFSCGVGHEATVGPYTQINPGAQIGGNCQLGERVLVGSGATVLPRVSIGAGATIASGATVFTPVPEGATAMGNPARRMRAFEA